MSSATTPDPFGAKLRRYAKLFVGGLLLGVVLIFASQNADPATVHLLSWQFELSLSLLIFFVLVIGIAVGTLAAGLLRWRRSHRRDA
jgi:uncharacterized integral membrane protein